MAALCGWSALLLGDWEQARQLLEGSCDWTVQPLEGHSFSPFFLGMMCHLRGEHAEAARLLRAVDRGGAQRGDLQLTRWARRLLAEAAIREGRPAEARALLEAVLDRPGLAEFDVTLFLPTLAWALLEEGDLARAGEVSAAALRRARGQNLQLILPEALRVSALVQARSGSPQQAHRTVLEGTKIARTLPNPYAEGQLLYTAALLYSWSGEPVRSRERLREALVLFQRLGARTDVERTEQLLAALG
jgi:hypothetical protein